MRNIIYIYSCLALVACGGGDGPNQIGSNSSPGSAVFQDFTASSVLSNICRDFAVPTDSDDGPKNRSILNLSLPASKWWPVHQEGRRNEEAIYRRADCPGSEAG